MNLKPKINFSFLKSKSFIKTAVALGLLGAVGAAMAADPGTGDILAGKVGQVDSTFGKGSQFEHIVYVVEIILGVAAYIKTKNLLSLVGICVVLIFTAVAFNVIS